MPCHDIPSQKSLRPTAGPRIVCPNSYFSIAVSLVSKRHKGRFLSNLVPVFVGLRSTNAAERPLLSVLRVVSRERAESGALGARTK
jgi:hypothetical protein